MACAQGTDPRASADEYEVHTRGRGVEIGAEYMVYSFSGQGQTFLAPDHLVVEVALFPPKGASVTTSAGEFTLRVDGKTIRSVSPQSVVAAMQRSQWRQQRGMQADIGMGNDTVTLGGQGQPPYGGQRRTSAPPRAPAPDYGTGLPKADPVRADELVVSTALPPGEFRGAVSGFIYFPFTGKASKIKTVDLVHGDTTLKLK